MPLSGRHSSRHVQPRKPVLRTPLTFPQRESFHMPDGPRQVARDEVFLSQLGKELRGPFPSRWTCPEVQPWLYGYDAFEEVRKAVKKDPFCVKAAVSGPVEPSVTIGKRISTLFSALARWVAV